MKKIDTFFLLSLFVLFHLRSISQPFFQPPFVEVPCSKFVSVVNDRELNIQIAQECKKEWKAEKGLIPIGNFGTYLRHVYVDDEIEKNELGIIKYKIIYVRTIIKKNDGKCKASVVQLARQYEGGGSYGRPYLVEVTKSNPVDCACANEIRDWLSDDQSASGTSEATHVAKKKEGSKGSTEGPFEKKFKNGNLELSGSIKNGQPDGVWKEFYENGQLKTEALFVDGKQQGKQTTYDETGALLETLEYQDNKKHGKWQTFSKNVVTKQAVYENDRLTGEMTYFDSEGNKTKVETYKEDKLNGVFKEWKNGKIFLEGSFVNGAKDGIWKEFDQNGKVLKETKWKIGIKQ